MLFSLKVSALTCQIKSNTAAHLVSWLGMKGFTSKDGQRFNTLSNTWLYKGDYCMGSWTLRKSIVSEHSLFFGIGVVQQLSRWFWICQINWRKILLLLELNKPLKMKWGCFGDTARRVNMRRSTWGYVFHQLVFVGTMQFFKEHLECAGTKTHELPLAVRLMLT